MGGGVVFGLGVVVSLKCYSIGSKLSVFTVTMSSCASLSLQDRISKLLFVGNTLSGL